MKIYRSHLYNELPDGTRDFYMLRYVFRTRWFSVRLHKIVRSDEDPHMHDHPFGFWSLLLSDSYTEHTPSGVRTWPRWSLVRRRATDLHRLELHRPVWTLVVAGPKTRAWGFDVDGTWVFWKDYLQRRNAERGGLLTRSRIDRDFTRAGRNVLLGAALLAWVLLAKYC